MDINAFLIALGGFCGALVAVGVVAKWLIKSAMSELLDDIEEKRQKAEIASTRRDGQIDTKFATLAQTIETLTKALETETKERHQWETDLERRKQHTKANHEQKMSAMDRRIEASNVAVEANTRRIIALEESNKSIFQAIVRVEEAVKASSEVSKTQFDQVCESIREISQRAPKT